MKLVQIDPATQVVVPREPTQVMLDAHGMCEVETGKQWLDEVGRRDYKAMIAAAPEVKAFELPEIRVDMRLHGEYRRGWATCLDEVIRRAKG